jgi:PhoPQ-activated pathogenicity-related protein
MRIETSGEMGQNTALKLGIPVLILEDVPGTHFGLNEKTKPSLRDYTIGRMFNEQDTSWSFMIPMAVSYMRAVTLLHSLTGVEEVVIGGSSKRGEAVVLAAAVDKRIKGVWSAGAFGGNFFKFHGWMRKYGLNSLWPEVGTKFFKEFQESLDPVFFLHKYNASLMMTLGSNEPNFPHEAMEEFYSLFPKDKNILYIANCGHSMGDERHIASWRAFIAHNFFERGIPKIISNVKQEGEKLHLNVQIDSRTKILDVVVYYATFEGKYPPPMYIWKRLQWEKIQMKKVDNGYVAEIPIGENTAYFVEVHDIKKQIEGYVSSIIYYYPVANR